MGARQGRSEVKTSHFFFKQVSTKKQYNKDLISYHKPLLDRQDFDEWESKYRQVAQLKKDHLLLPESYSEEKIDKSFLCCECPHDSEVKLTYEEFNESLKSQIKVRKSKSKNFTLEQLFYMLYIFCQASKEFERKKIQFGDIRPDMIMRTNKGDFKMVNVGSFPEALTAIEKVIDKADTRTLFYFAPEQVQYINNKAYGSKSFPNSKTDSFAIGLTIIQACLLLNSEELYKKNGAKRELEKSELANRLKKIKNDPNIGKIHQYIVKITELSEQKRWSSGEQWAALKPYADKILNLKPFSVKKSDEEQEVKRFRESNPH